MQGLAEAFERDLPFPLDPFQVQAIGALEGGRSALVTAPTGAGKTIVADYAAFAAMATGRKLVYTTPIKALSNQKYRQLVAQYGDSEVGIVTGDTMVNRDAPLLVMTTEILRNLLVVSKDALPDIGFVVVDEVHFLADRERGVVWEETLIALPRHIQVICLSATVSNAREVADWLTQIHGPTDLVQHDERPVPLEDYVYTEGEIQLVRDGRGRRIRAFPQLGALVADRSGRYSHNRLRERREREEPTAPLAPSLVARLLARKLLPTIYFRFGRRSTEEVAWTIVGARVLPPPDAERALIIENALTRTLHDMDDDTRTLTQVSDLLRLLPNGLAYHHAGLIHPLKALVEELFAAGCLQVVVATSTLAMGLHLPARSVVLGEMKKFNGVSFEPLTATEYRQMTGRAGRRGIDTMGSAVLVPSSSLPFEAVFRRMSGPPEPLRSAFELRYNTVLNLYQPDDEQRILTLLENNLAQYHREQEEKAMRGARPKRRNLKRQLYAMLDVLTGESLLDQQGVLKTKGLVARHIFNPWEIAVTTLLLDGSLATLEPPQAAHVMSWFIPSRFGASDEPRRPRRPARPWTRMDIIEETIETTITRLRGREERHGIELTPDWTKPEHGFVPAWCAHGLLSETVQEFGTPAGDALQLLGQTLDLLDQCGHALTAVFGSDDHHVAVMRRASDAMSHKGKLERLLGL